MGRIFYILLHYVFLNIFVHVANAGTLELVHVIFRHGNRTPVSTFATDAGANNMYYPFGNGELTLIGKQHAFDLGLNIRNRYNEILSKIYYPPEVQAFCSNVSRTQMTLQSVLTAMYPPVLRYRVHNNLMWQPISYQTLPTATDDMLFVRCFSNKFETKMDHPEMQELYDYVSHHSGTKITNSLDMYYLYDAILVQAQNGYPVPKWAKEIFDNGKLEDAALTAWVDIINSSLPQWVGPLIKKITDDSNRKINNELENNIFLYSGHDANIAVLLGLFGAYSEENKFSINYLSHIYIELHKIDNVYGFKVFFQNGPDAELIQVKLKSCMEDFCPFDKFVEATKHVYTPLVTCD